MYSNTSSCLGLELKIWWTQPPDLPGILYAWSQEAVLYIIGCFDWHYETLAWPMLMKDRKLGLLPMTSQQTTFSSVLHFKFLASNYGFISFPVPAATDVTLGRDRILIPSLDLDTPICIASWALNQYASFKRSTTARQLQRKFHTASGIGHYFL